jgi:hypothetical protein
MCVLIRMLFKLPAPRPVAVEPEKPGCERCRRHSKVLLPPTRITWPLNILHKRPPVFSDQNYSPSTDAAHSLTNHHAALSLPQKPPRRRRRRRPRCPPTPTALPTDADRTPRSAPRPRRRPPLPFPLHLHRRFLRLSRFPPFQRPSRVGRRRTHTTRRDPPSSPAARRMG